MAAAQSASSNTQTVEEAEDGLQEPDEAERCLWLQHDGRDHLQDGQLQAGIVPQMRYEARLYSLFLKKPLQFLVFYGMVMVLKHSEVITCT
jgi:hypothetical protein